MARTPTFCAATVLVMALSIASVGALACQIDCAVAPAPTPMSHTDSCGGHTDAPAHDNGSRQHNSHSHARIIAAAHSTYQRTTLQQSGLLPRVVDEISALAGANCAQGIDTATTRSSRPFFATLVLRV
jgi:hypothetical protein